LYDSKGKQGRQGEKYLAWQLPNSYETQLTQGGNTGASAGSSSSQTCPKEGRRGTAGDGGKRSGISPTAQRRVGHMRW
jgi:hypothetical protein